MVLDHRVLAREKAVVATEFFELSLIQYPE